MAKKNSKKKNKKFPFKINITKKMAKTATLLVVSTLIAKVMKIGIVKRVHLHIVVGLSDGTVLYEKSIGKRKKWENNYRSVARSKFNDTVKTGEPTRRIQSESPHLASGKFPYYGSWIDKQNGIVVAASGVEGYWDETFSKIIINVLMAIVYRKQEQLLAA